MSRTPPPDIRQQLREAIQRWPQPLYRLARRTGVHQATISRFVRGERGISLTSAARLAVALKLTLRPRHTMGKPRAKVTSEPGDT